MISYICNKLIKGLTCNFPQFLYLHSSGIALLNWVRAAAKIAGGGVGNPYNKLIPELPFLVLTMAVKISSVALDRVIWQDISLSGFIFTLPSPFL